MNHTDPRWPDFDYSLLPEIGDDYAGQEVVLVNRNEGMFITAPYGAFSDSPKATKHVLPRTK